MSRPLHIEVGDLAKAQIRAAEEWWRLNRPISRLHHDALAREADARPAFLREACAGDEALRREVALLLAQAASAQGVLDGPAVAGAAQMVSETSPSILTDHRLGAYQLEALIGRRGMGEVDAAEFVPHSDPVSVQYSGPSSRVLTVDLLRR